MCEPRAHIVPINAGRVACVSHARVDRRSCLKDVLDANGGVFTAGERWCLGVLEEMGLSRQKMYHPRGEADWEQKGCKLTAQVRLLKDSTRESVCVLSSFRWTVQVFHSLLSDLKLIQHFGNRVALTYWYSGACCILASNGWSTNYSQDA